MKYADKIIVDGEPLTVTSNGLPDSFKTAMISLAASLKSLLNELEYTTSNNHAESVTQDADSVITSLSGSNPTTYAITAITDNCGLENSATSAIQNTSYTTTIVPVEGYAVNNVTVVMGGYNITSEVYNSSTNTIKIPSVNGTIEINATAAELYTVTENLSNCTKEIGTEGPIIENGYYDAAFSSNIGYIISTVSVIMRGVDITSTVYNSEDKTIYIPHVTGNVVINISAESADYTITKNLQHCAISTNMSVIQHGEYFKARLIPEYSYNIGAVTIMMGETDITSRYNSETGYITIVYVSGNIVITASGTQTSTAYSVTKNLTYCRLSNNSSSVISGATYTSDIIGDVYYDLIESITVTMNDVDITSTAYNQNTIYIPNVTGDIVITVEADQYIIPPDNIHTITGHLTHASINNVVEVTEGDSYQGFITAQYGYTLYSVTVTMGGVDITSNVYSNGVINIANVTGDIVIAAQAIGNTYTITKNLTHVTINNPAQNISYGSFYSANIAAETGYTLETVTVVMNGTNITSNVYSNGAINIGEITGNVVITATASA